MKKKHISTQKNGWGLVETLLTLGTISALSVGIYMAFAPTDATAKTKAEQENIHLMSQNIINSFGLVNNYSQVSNSTIIGDNLVPSSLRNGNELISSWGSPVNIATHTIASNHDSFVIQYENTPKDICNRLSSAAYQGAYDVLVNGTSVLTANRSFNPITAASLCENGSELIFVFTGYGNTAYAADPLDLPPSPTSVTPPWNTPITNVVADPIDVNDATPGTNNPTDPGIPAIPVSPLPVIPTPPAAATPITNLPPSPVIAIPVLTACSIPASDYQNVNTCSAGTFGQFRQQRDYSCPEAWDVPSVTAWYNISNTCASCPPNFNENRRQWVAYTALMCAVNQYGYTNREQEQSSDRTGGYICPYGTQTLPAPTYTGWTAWSNTATTRHISDVCTNCPAPSTGTQTQWVGYTAAMCAAGQYGLTNRELEQSQSRSITYNCPYGTASLPAPTYGGWGAWANTGNTRAVNNGTCANCPAGGTESATQWVGYTANNCPAGQYGYTNRNQEQSRNRGYSYNCPAGTTAIPAPTYGGWSGWANTANTTYVSSACNNCPGSSSNPETQWAAAPNSSCPVGQTGTITNEKQQSRSRTTSYNCPAGTSSLPAPNISYTGWADNGITRVVSNTCVSSSLNGICPSRQIVIGCATYTNAGVRVGPISISTDDNGEAFDRGQYVRCAIGYQDSIAADGFPSMNGDENLYRLRERGGGPMSDWDTTYADYYVIGDTSSYVSIYAKKADGTQGNRCFGEAKVTFNYIGK